MAATQKRLVRKYYVAPAVRGRDRRSGRQVLHDHAAGRAQGRGVHHHRQPGHAAQARPHRRRDTASSSSATSATARSGRPARARACPRDAATPAAGRPCEDRASWRRSYHEHGALLPRHYWNLSFLANWTGGTMGLYLQDFPEYFGDVPVRDIGLLASEGRISIPVEDGTPAGILDTREPFLRVRPRGPNRREQPADVPVPRARGRPGVLRPADDRLGAVSLPHRRPGARGRLRRRGPDHRVPQQGEHTCSLAGEKLTEHQVMLAMEQAAGEHGPPRHQLRARPAVGAIRRSTCCMSRRATATRERITSLAGRMDRAVVGGQHRVCVTSAEPATGRGAAQRAARRIPGPVGPRQAESRRRGNEQYKHRYLYCRPGEDARFPETRPGTDGGGTR